jgi:tetratricopeptide (TPR) repeat protein
MSRTFVALPVAVLCGALGLAAAAADEPATPPAGEAAAASDAAPAPRTAKSPDPAPILARLQAADSAADRAAAAAELAALRPMPVKALAEFLARSRSSTDAERRAVLASINAEVPDEKGKFRAPGRQTVVDETANDNADWLAGLVKLHKTAGLADTIADVATIEALAASNDPDAAAVIFDFAFAADGVTYRDECGRTLRRMAPYSLPALIRGSEKHGDLSMSRYAVYQLERLDRQEPRKALADAPNEALKIAVLDAFKDSLYREAVYAVLDTVDDASPAVRRAARAAWMEYATGRAPKPSPKEKLTLPGGKLTDKPMPLWLNSRELADIAIRRRLEELTGTAPPARSKIGELSKQLFAFYDDRRSQALSGELDKAMAMAEAGKHAEAAEACDRILVQVPDFARRAEMAPIYYELGQTLEAAGKWREAAAAYGKANATDPKGPLADQSLARHHTARGKAAEAAGASGAAEFARAHEIDAAAPHAAATGGGRWMLFAGLGGGAAGLALLLVGLLMRRRA